MDIRILSGGGVNLDAHLSISDQDGTKMLSSDAKSQIAPSILTNEQWLLRESLSNRSLALIWTEQESGVSSLLQAQKICCHPGALNSRV